jgi:hypothetical protein
MSFIATIEIDEANFFWLEGLRRVHAVRNLLSAHLTLFINWALRRLSAFTALICRVRPCLCASRAYDFWALVSMSRRRSFSAFVIV